MLEEKLCHLNCHQVLMLVLNLADIFQSSQHQSFIFRPNDPKVSINSRDLDVLPIQFLCIVDTNRLAL
jgi:hypothetical protein